MPKLRLVMLVVTSLVAIAAIVGILNYGSNELDRPAIAADVIGTWQYTSDYPNQVIEVRFASNGTYAQKISTVATTATSSVPQVQTGRWDLKDQFLNVHNVLMKDVDGNWKPTQIDFWRMKKSRQRRGQAAIFGGIYADPDVWQELTKVE